MLLCFVGIVCFIHTVVGFPRYHHTTARGTAPSSSTASLHTGEVYGSNVINYRLNPLHAVSTGGANGRIGLDVDDSRNGIDVKREALILLDCLTSSKDPDDSEYDVEKDMRRDELLLANDYNDLKNDLRCRGLRTSGDKLEMITRLLLHIIDPSIKFDEMLVCCSCYSDLLSIFLSYLLHSCR